jgi:hypothetical protein
LLTAISLALVIVASNLSRQPGALLWYRQSAINIVAFSVLTAPDPGQGGPTFGPMLVVYPRYIPEIKRAVRNSSIPRVDRGSPPVVQCSLRAHTTPVARHKETVVESSVMAKKKAAPAPEPTRRPVAVTVKGCPEWRTWVEQAASHCRMSVSALVDIAVARYAKEQGFNRKPPER